MRCALQPTYKLSRAQAELLLKPAIIRSVSPKFKYALLDEAGIALEFGEFFRVAKDVLAKRCAAKPFLHTSAGLIGRLPACEKHKDAP